MRSGCLPDTQINNLASICITVNNDCLKPQYHTVDTKILLTLVYNKTNQTHDIVQIVYLFKILFLDIYPISPMLKGIYILII